MSFFNKNKTKFCPKCGREYEYDMKICPECNISLSKSRPWVARDDVSTWTVLEKNTGDMQADQIISVLSFYGIPAKKYYKGSSQYVSIFTGMTSIGVYVIVPEKELERARKILDDETDLDDTYDEYNNGSEI